MDDLCQWASMVEKWNADGTCLMPVEFSGVSDERCAEMAKKLAD